MELPSLIRRGRDLDAAIKEKSEELKEIKARLVEAGAGEHLGTDSSKALVIFPSASIKPDQDAIAEVKRLVGKTKFEKLFVETISLAPIKAFRDVIKALVAPDVAEEAIALCEKESSPQVRFS